MGHDANRAEDVRLLAHHLVRPKCSNPISVTSAAFCYCEKIPRKFSAFEHETHSPPLSFNNVPSCARSLVLLVEDPDAPGPKPFVHWLLVNLPPRTPYLRENIPDNEILADLGDARQGINSAGKIGYYGMKPPAGHHAHHYHFTLFSLDTQLIFTPGETVDRQSVLAKFKNHVISCGNLVGTYAAPHAVLH